MPNYVNTEITVSGKKEDIERFIKRHIKCEHDGSSPRFDFRTIIPQPATEAECPDEFNLKINPDTTIDTSENDWFNWYKWDCANWGTKWNACSTNVTKSDNGTKVYISFDTAWSPAEPIFWKLGEMHPELDIGIKYVEEQGPVYTGDWKFRKGKLVSIVEPESESKEAYEIMFEIWGNQDEYRFNKETGTYEYIDNND